MGDWHPAPRGAKARLERTFESMAERTGLEPATSGVTGQHSNQLNYRSAFATAAVVLLVGAEGFEPPTLSL